MLHSLSWDKLFIKYDLRINCRKIWLLIIIFLVGGCFISATEIQKYLLVEAAPVLCLEDELALITSTGFRFEKPVSNRLHKASVFAPMDPAKLRTDAALSNFFYSGETFLSILVIILFFYYYHATGEDGEKRLQFYEPFNI